MNRGTQRKPRRWVWYLFLIGLFLMGLKAGVSLSKRTVTGPDSANTLPAQSAAPTPAQPEGSAPGETPSQEPSHTPEPPSDQPGETPSDQPTSSELPPAKPPTLAQEALEGMTLREKICQMFVVFPSDLTGVPKMTQAGETTRQALEKFPVGGLLYNAGNMVSREQVKQMLEDTQSFSSIPLILTCDEEGGRVARLMGTVGTTKIGPMLDYAHLGTDTAWSNAHTIAQDMVSCGFNTDLAPVADVWSNPENTVIGDRAYSTDFAQAAQLLPAAVEGFHTGGVACALKHFPGHGDTSTDSHNGASYVTKTLDQLRQEELLPFQAGIAAGADMVMLGHLTVTDADSEPATFSHRLVTGLLREELGFSGVIITDSLQMKAVTGFYSSGEAAVKAVQAGVDILLCPDDLEEAVNALTEAVEQGVLTEARIDESVLRILNMKELRGIL